jgi:hypothetical protein
VVFVKLGHVCLERYVPETKTNPFLQPKEGSMPIGYIYREYKQRTLLWTHVVIDGLRYPCHWPTLGHERSPSDVVVDVLMI